MIEEESMPNDGSAPDHLEAIARQALANSPAPGLSVAVLLDGRPRLVDAYGFADLERTRPLDAAARFYCYSVTKTLIAATVLRLAERGRLELDAPVQQYLPDLPLEAPVTLRQLLNHTGGVPDYGGMPAYFAALRAHPERPWSAAEFLAHTLPAGLRFSPGTSWAYSNIGFLLLRLVVERACGGSLAVALDEHIVGPLGLIHTRAAENLADAHVLTPGYSSDLSPDEPPRDISRLYHPGWVSHGVAMTTAAELARMVEAIVAGDLLAPDSRAAMRAPMVLPFKHPLFRQPAYGLGLMIDADPSDGQLVGHGGGGPGYSAAALHLDARSGRRIACAVLANHDEPDLAMRLGFELVLALADEA
jgi:D-alanyl-D-alanine carboxypeptidase